MNKNLKDDIYEKLKKSGYWLTQNILTSESNKIDNIEKIVKKYSWKMFNYISNNKKIEFITYLEKIYAGNNISPPMELLEILREKEMKKFKEYALAFMMGFISDKYEKKEEV